MFWLPLIAIASSLINQEQQKKADRQALLNDEVVGIAKQRAQQLGANPFAVEAAGFPTDWQKLQHAHNQQTNTLGTALQAASAIGGGGGVGATDSSSGDSASPGIAWHGGDMNASTSMDGSSNAFSPGGMDSQTDSLMKRLDDYGIDYGGRRLIA